MPSKIWMLWIWIAQKLRIVLYTLVWKANPNITHWKATESLPSPHKAQNKADKNGRPHTNTKVNSPNLFVTATVTPHILLLWHEARWRPLTQGLIALFIYYYLCPGAKENNISSQTWVKGFYTDMFPIQTKSRLYKVNPIETKSSCEEQQASSRFPSCKHLCFSVILFHNLKNSTQLCGRFTLIGQYVFIIISKLSFIGGRLNSICLPSRNGHTKSQ